MFFLGKRIHLTAILRHLREATGTEDLIRDGGPQTT